MQLGAHTMKSVHQHYLERTDGPKACFAESCCISLDKSIFHPTKCCPTASGLPWPYPCEQWRSRKDVHNEWEICIMLMGYHQVENMQRGVKFNLNDSCNVHYHKSNSMSLSHKKQLLPLINNVLK